MQDKSIHLKNQSSLFLIEVIIAVFFFAITAVVCIRIFVKSHNVTDESRELTKGYIEADNMAQVFMNSGANIEVIVSRYSEYALVLSQEGSYTGTIVICYDSDFNPIEHPTDDITYTINSTAYELVLTQKLEDSSDTYNDCSSGNLQGYACTATISIYDVELSDDLITDTYQEDISVYEDNKVLTLPLDLYLGNIDTEL